MSFALFPYPRDGRDWKEINSQAIIVIGHIHTLTHHIGAQTNDQNKIEPTDTTVLTVNISAADQSHYLVSFNEDTSYCGYKFSRK